MTLNFSHVRETLFNGSLSQKQVDGINVIVEAFGRYGDGDRRKLAYLLATAKHETAHTMQPIHERGQRAYFDKYEPGTKIGKNLGNMLKGDGYKFRGRGYVQCTGRANYAKAGKKIGVDLLTNPDAALEPENAARILIAGCMEGWFTGRKLEDYQRTGPVINQDYGFDFRNARRVVNGLDKADAIAEMAERFLEAIEAPSQPVPAPTPAPKPETPPAAPPASPIPQPKEPEMITNPNAVVVDVKSGWASKINWTQALGLVFVVATMFGIPVSDELKANILGFGTSAAFIITYILRTFFTGTITPASAKKL